MTVDDLFPLPAERASNKGHSKYASLFARLVANTTLLHDGNPQSCWLWTGKVKKGVGYPHINLWVDGKTVTKRAHRVMLEVATSQKIPPDIEVDHLCHNPSCVNPDHLRAVQQLENLSNRRGYRPVARYSVPPPQPRAGDHR